MLMRVTPRVKKQENHLEILGGGGGGGGGGGAVPGLSKFVMGL